MLNGNDYLAVSIGFFLIGSFCFMALLYQHPRLVLVKAKKSAGGLLIFALGCATGLFFDSYCGGSLLYGQAKQNDTSNTQMSAQQRLIINQLIERKTRKILDRLEAPQTIKAKTIQLVNPENDGYANLSLDENGDPYFELRNQNDLVQGILTFKKRVIHRTGDIVIRPESPLYRSQPKGFNITAKSKADEEPISN